MDEQRVWLKLRKKRFLRILAVVLSFCVLFMTYPDIPATLSVFASEEPEQTEVRHISGFTALSDEIREQTVPVGTELTELALPDTLEAVITEGKQPSEDTKEGGNTDADAETGNGQDTQPEKQEATVTISGVTWQPEPAYDGSAEGTYIFTVVLPEGYALAEGVSLPEITVTVCRDMENETVTAAGTLLEELMEKYFAGLSADEIYDVILAMDEDTRLSMTADYEEVIAAMTDADEADERLQSIIKTIESGLMDAAERIPRREPAFFGVRTAAPQTAQSIPLRKLSGSGKAFVYYDFVETVAFANGTEYAFLDGVYGHDDAVCALGSGAILKASGKSNNSQKFIQGWYGSSAGVKVYVDVVKKGKDFDYCRHGGLYQVPGTGSPVEYRYFCYASGAQNCGPYYAYTYQTMTLTEANVSASLNDIDRQGSENSEDYTVMLTFDGRTVTLAQGSYTVNVPEQDSDEVTIVVTDNDGNSITTKFRGPLAVRYDGNGEGAGNVPATQAAWRGESFTFSGAPTRTGYSMVNWKDEKTGSAYTKGQTITFGQKSLRLLAQWRDTQKPDFTSSKPQVMIRAAKSEVEQMVKASLTITDNEPVNECTVQVTASDNITRSVGDKTVTVTVTDKAGNTTTKDVPITVNSLSLMIDTPVFTQSSKNLSAALLSPGGDAITETGIVWGIMTSPTTGVNNGRQKTTPAVTQADAKISVTADIQKGVTYYARAYAISGGETYYSNELSFGLGVPQYGTFTIKCAGSNTFTVTRTGGSDGAQTVYYRTVNGSAVGGTHFTHKADSLIFAAGETSKTITIAEAGGNAAYSGKPATGYSNADRTYSVEIYRVTGGGMLGDTVRAERTMTAGADYKIDRGIYTKEKAVENVALTTTTNGKKIADTTSAQGGTADSVSFLTNRDNEINYNTSTTLASYYTNDKEKRYLENTATGWYYRYDLYAYEYEDGYEHAYMGTQPLEDKNYKLSGNSAAIAQVAGQLWACNFLQGEKDDARHYYFPDTRTGGDENAGYPKNSNGTVVQYNGSGTDRNYVDLNVGDACYVYFGSTGANTDIWYVDGLTSYAIVHDKTEPQLVAVAPMAGGLYKAGDSFVVSLIFDEIVDSQNSTLSNVKVSTNWGDALYTGGADTNVLYFTGTVKAGAGGNLSVTGITNPGNIKDMCAAAGTACAGKSGNTTASVDSAEPKLTLTSKGVTSGTGTVTVKVDADQAKTSALRYAWSASTAMPAGGWVEASATELSSAKGTSGLSLSIRKEPGSGNNGEWYLHVLGIYDTTGAATHKYAAVNFGTAASPVSPAPKTPTLSVSADNSNWAQSRNITVTTTNAGSGTLKYCKAGTNSWKTLSVSAGSVSVTENGWYTFRLTSGEHILTQDVEVKMIDRINPTAAVGTLIPAGSNQTQKAGVYTKITLPVTFADSGSGVKTVQYRWTNTATTPTSGWSSLNASQIAAGKADISYTASESTETAKYLHVKVTDNLGNICTTKSAASCQVISQTAVNSHTPKIAMTGAPAKWTNDTVTLTWTLSEYSGKNYEVILPDGRKARSNAGSGEIWALRNGTYTVKVRDLDYGGENTAAVTVQYIDTTAPTVTVPNAPAGWKTTGQTVTFRNLSDSQSGVGKKYYKIITAEEYDELTKPEAESAYPTEGLTELSSSNSVSVSQNGICYVYYKFYDNAGDDSVGREANKTEGFVGPIQIDRTAPELTASYSTVGVPKAQGLTISVKAKYGVSGGSVERNGQEITALTVKEGSAESERSKTTAYQVTEEGTYSHVLTGGAGKTVTKTVVIYETAFVSGTGASVPSQLVAAGGTLTKPDDLERPGYQFKGWYTAESGGSQWNFTADEVNANRTLYACWKDETAPDVPVLQENAALPEGWTNTKPDIPLKLQDGVGVTELLVSIDGGSYEKVAGFTGSAGAAPCSYEYTGIMEGNHTYRFQAKDAAGNTSAASAIFTVKLDKTKPEIGTVTYENKAANLWQWIIGKTSLIIHVPVTDTGSGVTGLSFCLTPRDAAGNPDSGSAVTDTATVSGGEAKITFDADFRGTIAINCSDAAGNAADSVTIGADAGGVIVEDKAPDITIQADRNPSDTRQTQPGGVAVADGYYDTAPALLVKVKDDTDNAVTGGLASVTCQVGDGAEKTVTVDQSTLQKAAQAAFTIPASEIPTGITKITVTVTDNAGNEAAESITVKVRGPEKKPGAEMDYREEELKNLVPGEKYTVDGTEYTADGEGRIPLIEDWHGTTVSIVRKGNGSETTDSPAQSLSVPARPAAPHAPELSARDDTSITLQTIAGARYRRADGTGDWQDSTGFEGLEPGTIYSFQAYYLATDTSFASAESSPAQIATVPAAPAPDKLRIGYVAETLTLTDGIEAFTDAGCTTPVTEGSVEDYMGQTVYIRYPANDIIPASLTTAVSIPARPAKPTPGTEDASYPTAADGVITGLTFGTTYEYRVKDADGNFGAWKTAAPGGTKIENLPAGDYEVRVKAVETENAGFQSEAAAVTIGANPATRYETPDICIDYPAETLTGFVPGAKYTTGGDTITAGADGTLPIRKEWFGTTLSITRNGNDKDKLDSDTQSLPVPARPAAPHAPELSVRDDTSITLQTIAGARYRRADGTGDWQDSTGFEGLEPGTIYSFQAYYLATDTSFASAESSPAQIATVPAAPAPDKLRIGYVAETLTLTDGIEAFTDAGCTTPVTEGSVEDYMGQTVYIRYPANDIIPASLTTAVSIPARPAKPAPGATDASYPTATDGAITGLTSGTTYEYRVKDADGNFGAWKTAASGGTKIENLPAGDYEVRVKAVETGNAGFRSEAAAVTVGANPATRYETPDICIDYPAETLTGFVPGAEYTTGSDTITAGADGTLPIKKEWFGTTLSIKRNGNDKDKLDSDTQSLPVPARPAKPTPTGVDVSTAGGTGKLADLTAGTAYEVSTDGGRTWVSHTADGNGQITGLAPGTYVVRVKAGTDNFASEPGGSVKTGAYQIKVTFMVDGQKYKEIPVDYGAALTDVPPVPAKDNAIGAWCMDEQGTTPAVFTNITADMTVYAVCTTACTVTLQTGTGYTLSAEAGSESPVREGGSFTFRFALADGYQRNADFAVKVNGVKVELTAQEPYTYIITDIREDKTVTVEGVAKKPGGKPSNPGGGGDKEDDEPETAPPPSEPSDNTPSTPPVIPPVKVTPPAPGTTPTPAEKEPEGRKPGTAPKQEESGEPEKTGEPEEGAGTEKGAPGADGAEKKPADGTDSGQTAGTPAQQAEVKLGNGTVIVTVVCEEEKCTATVADTEKVVKAVLTPDQQELVNGGETIEIRIDVTDISEKVPAQDKEVVEGGIEAYREEVPGLVLGMYVDISMFIKIGAGDWNAITETDEPIEVVVNIPEKLLSDGREFYIIRAHNGEYTFMNDLDDAPDTITVSTALFSSYAIAYVETEGAGAGNGAKCGLCHICPTFLGLCYFIWLAVIIALVLVIYLIIRRKRQQEKNEKQ